ncbi:MAG: Ig-like domain-containing protein, partial [Acidobacteria bacterium]|nr:Ig-like domain-containing protein [Acidobacteriota bacterium]
MPTNSARVLAANVNQLALTFGRATSDDGARVVYAAADSAGVSQVFFYDGRNNLSRQVTFLRARAQDVPLRPTISGDGSRLAFATRRNVTGGNSDGSVELYLYDIPTNTFSRLTDALAQATAEIVSSLSDDGSLIAFNFPRILSGPINDADFTNNSEIYVAQLPARIPFSIDLLLTHAATHGREPSNEKVFAPDQIAYATGTNLALISAQTNRLDDRTFPRSFANTQVLVNRRPAQLLFISPIRTDFVIPPETETGVAEIVVRNHDGYESRATVPITPSAPGIFTENGDGTGAAIALDAETFLRSPFDPTDALNNVRRISIFATGVRGASQVEVFINNRPLTVELIAPTPDFPGLDEIHVVLQRSLSGAGVVPLVVRADGRESNPTTIHVRGSRRAANVTLTPTNARLGIGRVVQFRATVFDTEGAEIANAPIIFSSLDPGVAVIDSSGVVRGIDAGMTTITATAGDVSARATIEIFPLSLVINEALADPPDGLAGDANLDGVRSASQDEFVEIVNASTSDLDLGNYQILTRGSTGADTVRHTFAARTIVPPGTAIVVFGGAEISSFNPHHPSFGGSLVETASTGGLSLLNGGSAVTLRDPSGAIVEQLTYGGATTLEGDRNQSLTRAPDITGEFTLHQAAPEANNRAFSPGTQINAAPFAISVPLARIRIEPLTAEIVNGAQQQFTARALAADGREIPGVLFHWQSSAQTIASVDQSGLARGLEPGTSLITATARGLQSTGATLQVTNPIPVIRRIEITPASLDLNRGNSQQLTARAFDVNNQEVAPTIFNWSSNDPQIAIVDQAGLSRAVGLGTTAIIASVPDGAGGTINAQASLTARAPLVINEIHADVAPDNATTPAVEGDANRDGVRNADDDEFIELINNSAAPLDLSGIVIADSTNNRFTFPANTTLAAGRAVVIFGGGAPPLNDPAFGGSLVFTTNSLGLNDGGETVNIKLPLANSEVAITTQSYGSASTSGTPAAPSDQSLTRTPDAEAGATGGDFAAHISLANAAGRVFSPGTRADGTPFGSAPITRSEITPATAAIDINATQSFTARAFTNAGGVESEIHNVSFAWDASDQGKATVAPLSGSSTVATGIAPGSVMIRARAGGQQATANLTINPPPSILTRIEISPIAATTSLGGTRQFIARGFDQNNQELTGITFNWSSSNPNTAIIDQSGLATGVGIGSTSITAASGQVISNAASLQITPPVIPSAGQ